MNKKTLLLVSVVASFLLVFVFLKGSFFSVVTTYESPDVKMLDMYDTTNSNIHTLCYGKTSCSLDIIYTAGVLKNTLNVEVAQPLDTTCYNSYGDYSKLCLIAAPLLVNSYRSGNDNITTYRYTYQFFVTNKLTSNTALNPSVGFINVDYLIDYKNQPVTFKYLIAKKFVPCTDKSSCGGVNLDPVPGISLATSQNFTQFSTRINNINPGTSGGIVFELQIDSQKKLENFFVNGVEGGGDTTSGQNQQSQSFQSILDYLGINVSQLIILLLLFLGVALVLFFVIGIVIAKLGLR